MEEQRNIDEVFRHALSDYHEAPPGAVWQDIASRLDGDEKRRPVGFFLRWPWIVLSTLLIIGSGWMVVGLNRHGDDSIRANASSQSGGSVSSANVAVETSNKQSVTENNTNPSSESNSEQTSSAPAPTAKPVVKQAMAKAAITTPVPAKPASISNNISDEAHLTAVTESPATSIAPAVATTASVSIEAATPAPAKAESPVVTVSENLKRKPEHLVSLKSSSVRRQKIAPVAKLTPERRNVSRADLPAIAHSTPEAAPVPVKPQVKPAARWQKPAPERIAKLTRNQHRPLSSYGAAKTPEALQPDQSPLPASNTLPEIEADPRPVEVLASGIDPTNDRLMASSLKTYYPQARVVSDIPVPQAAPEQDPAPEKKDSAPTAGTQEQSPEPALPMSIKPSYKPTISLAALIGYEPGMGSSVTSRFTGAARLLLQASHSIAIGIQPAFRIGNLTTTMLSQDAAYQRSSLQVDSFHTIDNSPSVRGDMDTIYNYVIRENFDSIIVRGTSVGGSFWEIELPLIVQWKINKSWYVYGGPSVNFGGKLSFNDGGEAKVISNVRKDSLAQSQALPMIAFNGYFGKSPLAAYSTYQPATPVTDPSSVRFGYLFGLGYAKNRIMAEASLHQQLSGYSQMESSLRSIFADPHVRLSIGYLLFNTKPVKTVTAE